MDKRDYVKRLLQMIRVDHNEGREPLNWNWTKEDWDNDDPNAIKNGDVFENYYDPDKPEFTLERIGLTEEQVNELDLLRLDVMLLEDVENPTIQHEQFAKRHSGYVYTVELDAITIDHQDKLEEMLDEFIFRWYDKDVWRKVKPLLVEEVKEVEVEKRITFKKLANTEYKKWQNNKLEADDEDDLNKIQAESLNRNKEDLPAPERIRKQGSYAPLKSKTERLHHSPTSRGGAEKPWSHPPPDISQNDLKEAIELFHKHLHGDKWSDEELRSLAIKAIREARNDQKKKAAKTATF